MCVACNEGLYTLICKQGNYDLLLFKYSNYSEYSFMHPNIQIVKAKYLLQPCNIIVCMH